MQKKQLSDECEIKIDEREIKIGPKGLSARDYDSLNYLTSDKVPDTQELIKLIGENTLKCGVRVYRIMRNLQGCYTRIEKNKLKKAAKQLTIAPGELFQVLWTNAKIARGLEMDRFDQNRHRPPDLPLNILIFYLVRCVEKATGKPSHTIIGGFLSEQGITNYLQPSAISRRTYRYSLQQLKQAYNLFREVYTASSGKTLTAVLGFVEEMRRSTIDHLSSERDLLFPTWQHFLP